MGVWGNAAHGPAVVTLQGGRLMRRLAVPAACDRFLSLRDLLFRIPCMMASLWLVVHVYVIWLHPRHKRAVPLLLWDDHPIRDPRLVCIYILTKETLSIIVTDPWMLH